jgi:hypothetical protein
MDDASFNEMVTLDYADKHVEKNDSKNIYYGGKIGTYPK